MRILGFILAVFGVSLLVYAVRTPAETPPPPASTAWPYPFPVGRPADATSDVAFYRKRVRGRPNDALNQALLADACLRQARLTNDPSWFLMAEQAAQASLAHQPFDNDAALLALATVCESRHDFAEALALLDRVQKRDATLALRTTCLLALGRVDDAEIAAQALTASNPSTASYGSLALAEIARGHDDAAADAFRRALSREETGDAAASAWTRVMLGRFSFRRGRFALARALYDEALRIVPEDALALGQRAELEAARGELEAADDDYARAWSASQQPVWLLGRARVKRARGDTSGALALLESARVDLERQMGASAFGHRRDLANLYLLRGSDGDAGRAVALMRAETLRRRDAETLDVLAQALLADGQPRAALTAQREALRWGLRDADMRLHLAAIERHLGHEQAAVEAETEALRIRPTMPAPH